jgi:hypothetical protein
MNTYNRMSISFRATRKPRSQTRSRALPHERRRMRTPSNQSQPQAPCRPNIQQQEFAMTTSRTDQARQGSLSAARPTPRPARTAPR